jgi:hypothetical protein
MESSDCAVALDASVFHNRGGAELERFLDGARARGEVALLLNMVGDVEEAPSRSLFGQDGESIILPGDDGMIGCRRLPAGAKPTLAENLADADRDVALRLLTRPRESPWWSLSLYGKTLVSQHGGSETREPTGQLVPILVDGLGQAVAAVWTSPAEDRRWYFVPAGTKWETVLDWLVKQALPAYVPAALRRARVAHANDPKFQSVDETRARSALDALEADYAARRRGLENQLAQATAAAEPIRSGLLFGTGDELETAVSAVLRAAGFAVVELDKALGDTKSADLLITYGGERRLVEIKSASGVAGERLVADLDRHLATWPQLMPEEPVDGGVLVVNHQHRLDPYERRAEVYTRPEFVAALANPVIDTRQLLDWWRMSDWEALRAKVLGRQGQSRAANDRDP